MVAHVVGRIAVSDAPGDLAAIEIHGRDRPVRRLEDRQAVNRETAKQLPGSRTRAAGRCGGCRRCATWREVGGRTGARGDCRRSLRFDLRNRPR